VTVVCNFAGARQRVRLEPGRPREILAACVHPALYGDGVEMDPGAIVLGRPGWC
jgi:hypothetical protein